MSEDETRTGLFLNIAAQISFALGEVKGRLVTSERGQRFFTNITFECNVSDGELIFTALTWKDQQSTLFITCVVRRDGCVSVRYSTNEHSTEYSSPARALLGMKAFFEKCITIAV